MKKRISPLLTLMTQYGLKTLYQIAKQQLCIHQITNNNCASTRYCAILPDWQPHPPQPIQEVPPEPEQMIIKILDDLLDIINVPDKLLSDFDFWAHSVLKYQW